MPIVKKYKGKGKPIFKLSPSESGGFDVRVDSRADESVPETHHFAIEAEAHAWIRRALAELNEKTT